MTPLAQLKQLAEGKSLTIKDCGNGHIQIIGPMLVNWWPTSKSRTAHVAATRKGFHGVNAVRAIALAMEPPPVESVATPRSSNGYRKQKAKMFRKQKTCYWCHVQLSLDGAPGTEKATLDHIVPLKRGGLDNANNWTLACEPCNSKRGHDMPEVHYKTK